MYKLSMAPRLDKEKETQLFFFKGAISKNFILNDQKFMKINTK